MSFPHLSSPIFHPFYNIFLYLSSIFNGLTIPFWSYYFFCFNITSFDLYSFRYFPLPPKFYFPFFTFLPSLINFPLNYPTSIFRYLFRNICFYPTKFFFFFYGLTIFLFYIFVVFFLASPLPLSIYISFVHLTPSSKFYFPFFIFFAVFNFFLYKFPTSLFRYLFGNICFYHTKFKYFPFLYVFRIIFLFIHYLFRFILLSFISPITEILFPFFHIFTFFNFFPTWLFRSFL